VIDITTIIWMIRRFKDPIRFLYAIFQIKELVHMAENKFKKHMRNIDFWCWKFSTFKL